MRDRGVNPVYISLSPDFDYNQYRGSL
jgi:hypothetical protein